MPPGPRTTPTATPGTARRNCARRSTSSSSATGTASSPCMCWGPRVARSTARAATSTASASSTVVTAR
jgi:hypothetical protein